MRIVKFVLLLAGLLALLVVPALAQDATSTPVPGQQAQTPATPEASPAAQTEADTQTQVQIPAGPGFVRFANFLTEAGVIDVYVDGQQAAADVNPNGFTPWLELPSGSHSVTIVPAGTPLEQAIIGPFDVIAGGNSRMTIAATGSGDTGVFDWMIIPEDVAQGVSTDVLDNARIRLLNTLEEVPALNVELTLVQPFDTPSDASQFDAGTLFTLGPASFGDGPTSFEVLPGLYNITVTPAQTGVTATLPFSIPGMLTARNRADWPSFSNVALTADTNYLFAIVGAEDSPWLAIQTSDLGSPVSAPSLNAQPQTTNTDTGQGSQGTQGSSGQSGPTYP
jgi:hypothetical protein